MRLIALLLCAFWSCTCLGAPRYQGPRSPKNFDGEAFRNVPASETQEFWDVVCWQLSREPAEWPERVELALRAPRAPLGPGEVRVTFVSHATALIETGELKILTDPVWSERVGPAPWLGPRRHKAPGVALNELPPIDAVLISHNHYDHLDLPTLEALAERDDPLFIAGLGTARLLAEHGIVRAVDLAWWDGVTVGGAHFTFTPARHWSGRWLGDRNHGLWGAFFVRLGSRSIYFAGDTGWGDQFAQVRARLGAPDLALLPIGAYEPRWLMAPFHMSPAEAVRAHRALGAERSVAIHWGTFQLTDEALGDPPRALAAALAQQGLAPDAFIALENGHAVTLRPTKDREP